MLTVRILDDAMAAFNSMPVMNATPTQNDSIAMNHAGQAMAMDAFDQNLGGFDEALMYVHAPPCRFVGCHQHCRATALRPRAVLILFAAKN